MISPHLALPTSPTPSAFSMTPTLRGLRKWSITISLYKAIRKHSLLNDVGPGAVLQLPPDRRNTAQIGHGVGHGTDEIIDLFLGGVLPQGKTQGGMGQSVPTADGQKHMARLQRS